MFRWLSDLFKPYSVDDLIEDRIEDLVPGHKDRMARMYQQWHEEEARELKKDRLEQELEDAEWILQYEAKLNKIRGDIDTQRDKTECSGGDTQRPTKLDAYLGNLARKLSLNGLD